jgi:hypothetical protein
MTGQLIIGSTGVANAATLKVNNSSASSFNHSIEAFTPNMTASQTNMLVIGASGSTKNSGYIGYNWVGAGSNSNYVSIGHWGADHLLRIYGDGSITPGSNATQNLGSATLGWANVYTNDLHLSNMNKPEGNDIDGTTGDWTIQEGKENLYIINNKTGKKYKFNLIELQ